MGTFEPVPLSASASPRAAEQVGQFLRLVYGWMCAGLAITAAVAYGVAGSPAIVGAMASNPVLLIVLVAAQLGLVFVLAARAQRLSPGVAALLFIAYAALTGVTLSLVLLAYTGASIASTFVVTAGMFGALALFGTTTSRNLAGVGQFMMLGLIGLILASVVGFFWQNDALQFLISVVGVIVFAGLAAYDAQRLRQMALSVAPNQMNSYAVVGALSLYLNFINLFLFILRLTGSRR
ncbi:MAG: Bax inhibitor-1/YccA family protein [Candidatus Rokubacteria bacterium]|nr:Bax inhibitor-1/YccA family protein [Candidatus Rokubacteria bacterium]